MPTLTVYIVISFFPIFKNNDKDDRKDEDVRKIFKSSTLSKMQFVENYQNIHPAYYNPNVTGFTLDVDPDEVPNLPNEAVTEPRMKATTLPIAGKGMSSKKTQAGDKGQTQTPELGDYHPWTLWHCSQDCKSPHMVREKVCKKIGTNKATGQKCDQPKKETKPGTCYIGKKCPRDCKDYQWGIDCKSSCNNCEQPCNKFLGNCSSCKPGFQGAENSCTLTCGPNRFGKGCRESCVEKCGADCIERIYGDCEAKYINAFVPAIILCLFIPVVIFIIVAIQRRGRNKLNPNEEIRTKSSATKSKSQGSEKSEKSVKDSQASDVDEEGNKSSSIES